MDDRAAAALHGDIRPRSKAGRWRTPGWGAWVGFCILVGLLAPTATTAQAIVGRAMDAEDDRPLMGALIRLEDPNGEALAYSIADSVGRYALSLEESVDFRVIAEAFGYRPFSSPLLEAGERDEYVLDLALDRAPVPLPGLVVSAARFSEIERGLRLVLGVHTNSLRFRPFMRDDIERHLEKGHLLEDLMRWSNLASITTRKTTEGAPCFQWRNRHCLPVYLNGMPIVQERVPLLPLEMVEVVVVMGPGETIAYNSGAVLLYTAGWVN